MLVDLKRHRIEKVCSDETRPSIAQPWLDLTDGAHLVATDGYTLAVVPIEADADDTAGPIPLLALDAARKSSTKGRVAEIKCDGRAEVESAGATFDRPQADTLPDWREFRTKTGAPLATVGVNARLLFQLAQALGSDSVKLTIYSPTRAFAVDAIGTDAFGFFIPVRLAT